MNRVIVLLIVITLVFSGCSSVKTKQDTIDKLLEYKDSYVGNSSAISNILLLLEVDHNGIRLNTDEEPYGILIKVDEKLTQEEIDYDTAIMFALIKNLSYINFISKDGSINVERYSVEKKYKIDLRKLTDDKERLIEVIGK